MGCHVPFTEEWQSVIGGVLQRLLSFGKVVLSPQRNVGALSEWLLGPWSPPRLRPFSLDCSVWLGGQLRVLVVPIFSHLWMMEAHWCAHWDLQCCRLPYGEKSLHLLVHQLTNLPDLCRSLDHGEKRRPCLVNSPVFQTVTQVFSYESVALKEPQWLTVVRKMCVVTLQMRKDCRW